MTNLLLLFVAVLFCQVSLGVHLPLTRIQNSQQFQKRGDVVSLLGDGTGAVFSYSTQINLGSPAQQLNVLVDSGSSDLIVFGAGCEGCNSYPDYNPSSSSSSATVSCVAPGYVCEGCASLACTSADLYGSGQDFSGIVYTDKFSVGDLSAVPVAFAVINEVTPDSNQPAFGQGLQGLWGLAYDYFSFAPMTTFDALVQNGLTNSFSMCLTNNPVLSLGVDYSKNTAFQWTPITNETYYQVGLTAVAIGGAPLDIPANQLKLSIVDSGTTELAFSPAVFNEVYNAFEALCSTTQLVGVCGVTNPNDNIFGSNGLCYAMTQAQINAYPTLQLSFQGISSPLVVTPSQYLFPYTSEGQTDICGGIGSSGQPGINILGDVFMSGYHVVFDRKNLKIGFGSTSTCPNVGEASNIRPMGVFLLSAIFVLFFSF